MKNAALASLLFASTASAAEPLTRDLQSVPHQLGPMKLIRLIIDGELIGRAQWPFIAEYGFGGDSDALKLQCWNDQSQMGSCSDKHQKKIKLAKDRACYTEPDYAARFNAGASIEWWDGTWTCSMQFKKPFFTPKGAAEEKQTATKYGLEARAAILANRAGQFDEAHAWAITAARNAGKQRR